MRRPLSLRLSNAVDAAVEFTSAPDPGALADAVRRAFEEFCHRQRAVWELTGTRATRSAELRLRDRVALHLHVEVGPGHWTDPLGVAPAVTHGWPADPLRQDPTAQAEPWRRVVCHWPLPPCDAPNWSAVLAWCQNAAEYGRVLRGLTSRVAREVQPPAELSDPDRRGGVA